MLVVFGIHRKKHLLSQRQAYCTTCRRPSTIVYAIEKRAFHVFWIPLVPLGSSTHMTCPACGSTWNMSKVPLDMSYWGYLFLAIGLFFGVGFLSALYNVAGLSFLAGTIPTILVSIIYLYTVPSSIREHFDSIAADDFSANIGAQAAMPSTVGYIDPYTAPQSPPQYSAPYGTYVPPSPTAASIYAPAESKFISCPSCGMRMETPPPGAVGTCPYCQSPFRK